MSTNETSLFEIGHAKAKISNAKPPADEDLVKLIDSLKESGSPVQERFTGFRTICKLLNGENNPPIRQAVDAGLIPVLNLLLSKTPSDWIFEVLCGLTTPSSDGDAGSKTKLITASIWLPPLLELITQTQLRALWATSNIVVEGGFRDEAVTQGLLETLTKIKHKGRSRKLRNYSMGAVADFFLQDMPLLQFNAARPAIRFLARSLKSSSMDVNRDILGDGDILGGGYDAIWALTEMAENGSHEYIQEMMNTGIVDALIGLMCDLMKEGNGYSLVWIKITACIAFLIMGNDSDEHRKTFVDAGIFFVSVEIFRDSILENNPGVWKNVSSWIAHLMMESGLNEHRVVDAGILDFLPRLLQHDLGGIRTNGSLIALAIARFRDSSFNTLLLKKGCVRMIFKNATIYHSEEAELRPCSIDVLANLCIWGSDDLVKTLIFKGYHRPVADALDEDLFDDESFEVQELWTGAAARIRSLIAQDKWLQVHRMILYCLRYLTCGNSS